MSIRNTPAIKASDLLPCRQNILSQQIAQRSSFHQAPVTTLFMCKHVDRIFVFVTPQSCLHWLKRCHYLELVEELAIWKLRGSCCLPARMPSAAFLSRCSCCCLPVECDRSALPEKGEDLVPVDLGVTYLCIMSIQTVTSWLFCIPKHPTVLLMILYGMINPLPQAS